jgi:hypothetical protein
MTLHKTLTILACSLLILGCATEAPQISNPNPAVATATPPENTGVIVGRIADNGTFGTGISFTSVITGLKHSVLGAKEYSIQLPEGEYELSGIGSRAGSLGAFKTPLTFKVISKQINYVGTVSVGCVTQSSIGAWYGVKNCGFLALSDKCTVAKAQVPMCVIDEQKDTISSFLAKNPAFASMPVVSASMK